MSGFKLIALRPTEGCETTIIKNLTPGKIYQFLNNYDFILEDPKKKNSKIVKIENNKKFNLNLYDIGKLKISISAIVGKNGSGKSSLMDLFYSFCYAIAVIDNKIKDIDDLTSNELQDGLRSDIGLLDDVLIHKRIACEMYYEINSSIRRITLKKGNITCERLFRGSWKEIKWLYSDFFYSVATNYSLYGLNSLDHQWYNYLFHKNDGYQIPLVINPYRVVGNIDVNSELHLAQTRTLLNLSSSREDFPVIVNSKRIARIKFVMDIIEIDSIRLDFTIYVPFWKVCDQHSKTHGESIFELFNKISSSIANFKLSATEMLALEIIAKKDKSQDPATKFLWPTESNKAYQGPDQMEIRYQFVKYVIHKVYKMCLNYPNDYGIFLQPLSEVFKKRIVLIQDTKALIRQLSRDKSHLTLKIRQALYSIKGNFFDSNQNWYLTYYEPDVSKISYAAYIPWSDVKKFILDSQRKNKKHLSERMQIVPGAFAKPKIEVLKDKNKKTSYSYSTLSSGEQQLANTIQGIYYHIYNLHSVHRSNSKMKHKLKYKYINLILDEIELYFHPEFQRCFIRSLLDLIGRMELPNIKGINILFSTHSPFILSDIPSQNILHLKLGSPEPRIEQTFGANIHDLLANDFFLENGFMGEFAKEKINDFIDFLSSDNKKSGIWNMNYAEEFINLIGEPYLKNDLFDLLQAKKQKMNSAGMTYYEIEKEIQRLTKLQKSRK